MTAAHTNHCDFQQLLFTTAYSKVMIYNKYFSWGSHLFLLARRVFLPKPNNENGEKL